VNLAYSSAKTKARGRPCGEKVPDSVLSKALEISKIPVPLRLNQGERGDVAEAMIAYAWTKKMLTLEEAVNTLCPELARVDCDSRSLERELAAKAFASLVKLAASKIVEARAYS
jgi:hypothetical protein